MRFNLTRISSDDIKLRLGYICNEEGFTNYHESINYISKICKGQMRDAITYLEKVAAYSNNISIENTLVALGNYSYKTFFDLTNSIIDGDEGKLLTIIDDSYNSGADLKQFIEQYLNFLLDVAKFNIFKSFDIIQIPSNFERDINNILNFNEAGKYYKYVINNVLDIKNQIKTDSNVKSTIEIMLLKIANCM